MNHKKNPSTFSQAKISLPTPAMPSNILYIINPFAYYQYEELKFGKNPLHTHVISVLFIGSINQFRKQYESELEGGGGG